MHESHTFSRQILTTGNSTLPANQVLCIKEQTPTCTLYVHATNTTCDMLASQCNITSKDFVQYNGNVNDECNNLVVGQPVSVFPLWTRSTRAIDVALTDSGIVLRGHRCFLPDKYSVCKPC